MKYLPYIFYWFSLTFILTLLCGRNGFLILKPTKNVILLFSLWPWVDFHLHIPSQLLYFSVSRTECTAELCFLMYHLFTVVLHNSCMLLGDAQLIVVIHTINCIAGYLNYLFHIWEGSRNCREKVLLEVKGKLRVFP